MTAMRDSEGNPIDGTGRRIVRCGQNCGAYFSARTPEEAAATLKHWQEHEVPSHHDFDSGRWDESALRFCEIGEE